VFEIGNSLREARDRQGRSFPDLERKTQIRSRYLRALEEEDFDTIPALAYTRGFLRVYANELGLDGQLYVDEFNSRFAVSEEGMPPFGGVKAAHLRAARAKSPRWPWSSRSGR